MNAQRAIFVPGHGVAETVRSARLIPKIEPTNRFRMNPKLPSHIPDPLELWNGDLCGDLVDKISTRFSTLAPQRTVSADKNSPVVAVGKSLVAVIPKCACGWYVEFQSEFADKRGQIVRRTTTIDDYGTAYETLSEPEY